MAVAAVVVTTTRFISIRLLCNLESCCYLHAYYKMTFNELLPVLSIVTVDDSPIVSQRIEAMLKDMVHVNFLGNARNTKTALQLISRHLPDVVILDIYLQDDMPEVNGINLLITLRKKYPQMKIIMLTNLVEPQYRNTCIAFGANYFLDKSIDFDSVPGILNEITQFISSRSLKETTQ